MGMRAALWLLALFAVAAGLALLAGGNPGTVALFWAPWRVDLSLNLALLALAGLFVVLHLALRALALFVRIPQQARRWRARQRERVVQGALVDAQVQLMAGRYVRARKAAEKAIEHEQAEREDEDDFAPSPSVLALAHLLAADSAHALQDRTLRDTHLAQALAFLPTRLAGALEGELKTGARLRAARWAIDDRDPRGALARLDELPQGGGRRTVALRLRLKAARQAGQWSDALETARLLAKHRAFSGVAADGIVRGLTLAWLTTAHDGDQVRRVWAALERREREMPEIVLAAVQRWLDLGGDGAVARDWLQPVWERVADQLPLRGDDPTRIDLARSLERALAVGLSPEDATQWLMRIESALRQSPRDPVLLYLAGAVCAQQQLWGKAQQSLSQLVQLPHGPLHATAWRFLAQFAEHRGDTAAASTAWKSSALASQSSAGSPLVR
jgi:HemY protein